MTERQTAARRFTMMLDLVPQFALLVFGFLPADVVRNELAAQARVILEKHCYACHGQEGSSRSRM